MSENELEYSEIAITIISLTVPIPSHHTILGPVKNLETT
jgi:hypothetical protein